MTQAPLSSEFLTGLPAAHPLRSLQGLESRLAERLQAARRAWPLVTVPEAAFLRHWAQQLARSAEALEDFERLHVEDLFLAFACSQGELQALLELRRVLVRAVTPAVRGVHAADGFVEEVHQRTMDRLLVSESAAPPRIFAFQGRGPLAHWLRAVAVRTALNLRRSDRQRSEVAAGDDLKDFAGPLHDPGLELLKGRYGAEFTLAMERALRELTSQERNVLRMHFVDALSLNQIAVVYQANKSTISRWITRARGSLLDAVRRDLEVRLGFAGAELESLMRDLGPGLHLSLRRVLVSQREDGSPP